MSLFDCRLAGKAASPNTRKQKLFKGETAANVWSCPCWERSGEASVHDGLGELDDGIMSVCRCQAGIARQQRHR